MPMNRFTQWLMPRGTLTFAVALTFVFLLFLTGGASRADAQSQLLIRTIALAIGAFMAFGLSRDDIARVRVALLFAGAAGVLLILHLVPLPPAAWFALPGRSAFEPLLRLAEVDHHWRPISLTPDQTVNSLLAILPPLAAILCVARLPGRESRRLLTPILAMILVSGLVGLLQLSSGHLYLYRITNADAAVGLFANRNHQGMLLAMALPMLAVFAARRKGGEAEAWSFWLAIGVAAFMVPLIVVTGSRSALVLALLGLVSSLLLYGPRTPRTKKRHRSAQKLVPALLWIGGIVLIGVTAASSRAVAVQRLFSEDVAQELRVKLFTPMIEIGLIYFPVGAGFGSFVDVFKMHEPIDSLEASYLNHAHNDLMELFIEGGLPALCLVVAFGIWWMVRTAKLWTSAPRSDSRLFGRLGSVLVALLAIGSLADYPLRTPTLSVLFIFALCWMSAPERRTVASDDSIAH